MNIFSYDFKNDSNKKYPAGWIVENNCENPNLLGWVDHEAFCLLHPGNKHLPLTPSLADFSLHFHCLGDRFFPVREILIYFHYNRKTREGYCLKYKWGIFGNTTHYAQQQTEEYTASIYRYFGKRKRDKYELLQTAHVPGFIKDMSDLQFFSLNVKGCSCEFIHNDNKIIVFGIPDNHSGLIAFDREGFKGALRIDSLEITSSNEFPEKTIVPERKIEFPSEVNGIISPYYFHLSVMELDNCKILKLGLSGGPDKKPEYPDINRCRFNEKMYSPYVRIVSRKGMELGKYYIFNGSVGLDEYHWNIDTSVMNPADGQCPLKRDIIVENIPADAVFIIGYEKYVSEDTINLAGGPSEAIIDKAGKVIYAGEALVPGSISMRIKSPENKNICDKIPKDIPFYDDALKFARNNHFFYEYETAYFICNIIYCNDNDDINKYNINVILENEYREEIRNIGIFKPKPVDNEILNQLSAKCFSTETVTVRGLKVGVYHIRFELLHCGLKICEKRNAFEIMPKDPAALSAPETSGLPKLFPNILSGIKNEHFYPWGHYTSDIIHYSYAGNNFFKVAREFCPWELLHLYGRKWNCWLKPWRTIFKERGIEPNVDLIKKSDACLDTIRRTDLWAINLYRNDTVYNALLNFLRCDKFVPIENNCFDYEKVTDNPEKGITPEQFRELINNYWKAWILFFTETITNKLVPEMAAKIKAVNPQCDAFEFCPVYPTYGSVYKAGYFPYYFGKNLRSGIEKYLTGPNGFEDYPYSSGYAIARGIYQLASCKLEAPKLKLYPEMFGVNGETLDGHVVYAHPPYGQSDPPEGFLTKQFYEYSYAVCWFDTKGFNFWNDHGYHIKTWDRENYDEMLKSYAFISRTKPAKPLKTSAFVFSLDACFNHPDYFEDDEEFINGGYMYNTAEEAVAFAYEQARGDGQTAGFVMKLEDIDKLDPDDVDMLVLPPLCGIGEDILERIRILHEQGVNLMGFEDMSGLEDLFGITKTNNENTVTEIRVIGNNILAELAGCHETSDHPLCRTKYIASGADVLLESKDGIPVLVMNKTEFGLVACYTLPPTVVKRAEAKIATYGQESISNLINRATAIVMRYLSSKQVETSEGKAIAFRDRKGNAHIIISEDAWPHKGRAINPLVTINLPNINPKTITCDKNFSIVAVSEMEAKICLQLKEHESARIYIPK